MSLLDYDNNNQKHINFDILLCVVLVFLFTACGQNHYSSGVDISNTYIIWEGNVYDDSNLAQRFGATMSCLNSFGIYRNGSPYIVIVQDHFRCGEIDLPAAGCYSSLNGGMIYLTNLEPLGLEHEVVHWATNSGDETYVNSLETSCWTIY